MELTINVDTSSFKRYRLAYQKFQEDLLEIGGSALYAYLIEYHAQVDWREANWFAGPGSGEFQRKVVEGWQPPVQSGNTIKIRNTFGLLSWKVSGGIITPQRATHLTIPLIPEARHRLVAEFYSATGDRLFRAGQALCRKIGKKIEAVYALSLGVKQNPYPRALPKIEDLQKVVRQEINTAVKRIS